MPKTLIFAKDDSHADDIVQIVREEFGKGNDFCQKITYKTTGEKPEDLLAEFRNSYNPRIAVTVDMIATGTDVKPLEMRDLHAERQEPHFFEQMKGRGVRVITDTDLQAVTPDARRKTTSSSSTAVGVCEQDLTDTGPLEQKPTGRLREAARAGRLRQHASPTSLSSLAGRLARLDRQLSSADRAAR